MRSERDQSERKTLTHASKREDLSDAISIDQCLQLQMQTGRRFNKGFTLDSTPCRQILKSSFCRCRCNWAGVQIHLGHLTWGCHMTANTMNLCVCVCVIHEIAADQFQIQMKTDPHILQRLHSDEAAWAVSTKLRACTSCVCVCLIGTSVCFPRMCVKQGQLSYVCFSSWTEHIWCNTRETGGNHNMELREFRSPGAIMMANAACGGLGVEEGAVVIVSSPCASPCGTHFANPSSGPTQNHQPSISSSK